MTTNITDKIYNHWFKPALILHLGITSHQPPLLDLEEVKQSCPPATQGAGAHLCSWAISWLRSSSSLMPVSSTDPVELVLSWGERHWDRWVGRKGELGKKIRWKTWQWQKVRTEMTRTTMGGSTGTWMKQTSGEMLKRGKRNETRGGGEQRGTKRDRSSPLISLAKQKTQEGNTNASHSEGRSKKARQCMHETWCNNVEHKLMSLNWRTILN